MIIDTKIGRLDLKNFAQGKQAECIVLHSWEEVDAPCVLKIVDKGFTEAEANLLMKEMIEYRNDLMLAGVQTSENYEIRNHENKIVMIDSLEGDGQDLSIKLNQSEEPTQYAEALLDFIKELPKGEIGYDTEVIGDFKPANFVMGKNGLVFIDMFAPKRRGKDGLVTPYFKKIDDVVGREAITFLCGDRRGQVGRLLAMFKRYHPHVSEYANEYAREIFKDDEGVTSFIENEIKSGFEGIDNIYKTKEILVNFDRL